MPGPVLRRD